MGARKKKWLPASSSALYSFTCFAPAPLLCSRSSTLLQHILKAIYTDKLYLRKCGSKRFPGGGIFHYITQTGDGLLKLLGSEVVKMMGVDIF